MDVVRPVVDYVRQLFNGMEVACVSVGLYQSSSIRWPWDESKVRALGVSVVVDLQGGFDPTMKFLRHYHYWPIKDEPVLPNLRELEAVASFAARCVRDGHRVLTHCTAGYNRSGLVNAVVLCQLLHVNGKTALDIVRAARPGAVYNPVFEKYLLERR